MNTIKKSIYILNLSFFLFSCNGFEKQFYDKIESVQKEAIEKNKTIRFNLAEITDFEWVKMLHINGNESVPINDFEIEPVLKHKTTDLDTYKNRFYFLNSKNEIIEKEVNYDHSPNYSIEYCFRDSLNENEHYQWLSKEECNFYVIPNAYAVGTGTVFLLPQCETKFDKNNFGIFYKEK